jgi:3-hydroxyisobutyrate dehydrogenase
MGAYMAANLLRAGWTTSVWNRSAGKDDDILSLGGTRVSTLAELASASDIVVLCVTDAPQVEAVLSELAPALAAGTLVIDCSTTSPLRSQDFARELAQHGVAFVDAPVSGGSEGARLGTLTIMVGGSDEDVARATPVLEAMGKTITHLGAVGAGQWTKAINQVIIAGTYLGVAEGVALGLKAGLDMEKVVAALSGGAASSWVLQQRSGRMIENDYPLGFKVSLHHKDLGIALDLAQSVAADLPVTALAAEYERELMDRGHGDDDMSALARIVRERSGLPD